MAEAGAEDVKFSAGFFDVASCPAAQSASQSPEEGGGEIKTTKVVTLFVKSGGVAASTV